MNMTEHEEDVRRVALKSLSNYTKSATGFSLEKSIVRRKWKFSKDISRPELNTIITLALRHTEKSTDTRGY